jgi:hypothetical protein
MARILERGQGVQKQCNGMRSVVIHKVTMVVRKKLRIHAVLPAVASGQLPFLGSHAIRAYLTHGRPTGQDANQHSAWFERIAIANGLQILSQNGAGSQSADLL